jgi:hypothetical protein
MTVVMTTTLRITRLVVHQSTSLWSLEALMESSYLVLPLLLLIGLDIIVRSYYS